MKEGLYLLLSLAQVTPTGWRKQTGLCLLTFAFWPLPGSKQKGRLPVRISEHRGTEDRASGSIPLPESWQGLPLDLIDLPIRHWRVDQLTREGTHRLGHRIQYPLN